MYDQKEYIDIVKTKIQNLEIRHGEASLFNILSEHC